MDVELAEIRDFLAEHPPFDALPAPVLDRLPRQCTMQYARRGSTVLEMGGVGDGLYVVRSGAADITDETGDLVERVGTGGAFGMSTLLEHRPYRYRVTAIEDTLLLVLPGEVFERLASEHAGFGLYLAGTHTDRLQRAIGHLQRATSGSQVLGTPVRQLVSRAPVTTAPGTSIRDAAALMAADRVSSLPVVEDGRLVGIMTDRDLRSRVVAVGVDPARPVRDVMTPDPVTLPDDSLAFEALIEMVSRTIHHLPLTDAGGRLSGLVSTTDLIRLEESNPVYLAADITRQHDLDGVVEHARRIASVAGQLVDHDVTAADIGRVVTALGDAVRRRTVALVVADLGPPPAAYSWVALGSVAREEEGLSSDQDHALVLTEGADAADPWFAELAEGVTATLERCGWPRCKGDAMATNPRWRLTVPDWQAQFRHWTRTPDPTALVQTGIFFDMRHVAGDPALVARVRSAVVPEAAASDLLVGHLGREALEIRPPLGFFRNFVLEHEGEHRDTLDIKRGITAIVQLARVHSLRAHSAALGTVARIDAAEHAGVLPSDTAEDLRGALELMSYLRLHHQVDQVRRGEPPDNRVDPSALPAAQRRHLRDAFGVVRSAQEALARRLGPGFL